MPLSEKKMSKDLETYLEQIGYSDKEGAKWTRTLIIGESGSGKTTLAGTWPAPFFADYEGGIRTLKDLHVPYVNLHEKRAPYDQTVVLMHSFRDRSADVFKDRETFVIDSWTELTLRSIYYEMRNHSRTDRRGNLVAHKDPAHEKPEWDDYAAVLAQSMHIAQLGKSLNGHFVVTCQMKYGTDSDGNITSAYPNILGSYRELIMRDFDFVFITSKGKGTKPEYKLHTGRYRGLISGKVRGNLDVEISDPSYDKIMKSLK